MNDNKREIEVAKSTECKSKVIPLKYFSVLEKPKKIEEIINSALKDINAPGMSVENVSITNGFIIITYKYPVSFTIKFKDLENKTEYDALKRLMDIWTEPQCEITYGVSGGDVKPKGCGLMKLIKWLYDHGEIERISTHE